MNRRALGLGLGTAVAVGVITHAVLLFGAPFRATDMQIAAAIAKGSTWNRLKHNPVPKAGTTTVPLANPDSFTSRAFIDLSKGPFLLNGPVPKSCVYWSVSVFGHNTDTMLIMSDRDFPDGQATIAIARLAKQVTTPVDGTALLKSDKGVLLLRCFMRDPIDKAYMEKLDAERKMIQLAPMPKGGKP